MKTIYGSFTNNQINETKVKIRKKIYFLLLIVDPKTKQNYKNVNVDEAYDSMLHRLNGLNEILNSPQELVTVMSLLQEAKHVYDNEFDFNIYRKLVLDAGAEIMKVGE